MNISPLSHLFAERLKGHLVRFGPNDSSVPVKAFMKVDRDLLSILKKGSLQGYFSDPHSTVCSRMCGTPVLSMGVVLNWTLKYRNKDKRHLMFCVFGTRTCCD